MLADKGWTLPRLGEDREHPSQEQKENEERANKGMLARYRDITKRRRKRSTDLRYLLAAAVGSISMF